MAHGPISAAFERRDHIAGLSPAQERELDYEMRQQFHIIMLRTQESLIENSRELDGKLTQLDRDFAALSETAYAYRLELKSGRLSSGDAADQWVGLTRQQRYLEEFSAQLEERAERLEGFLADPVGYFDNLVTKYPTIAPDWPV